MAKETLQNQSFISIVKLVQVDFKFKFIQKLPNNVVKLEGRGYGEPFVVSLLSILSPIIIIQNHANCSYAKKLADVHVSFHEADHTFS